MAEEKSTFMSGMKVTGLKLHLLALDGIEDGGGVTI